MPASHTTAPQVLNALNMSAVAPVAGYGGVAIQIQGTFTGTITFEASVQGSEFEPFRVTKSDNSTAVTTATTTGVYVGTVAGYSVIRARMSSYSNGGASVMIGAAPAAPGGAGGGGGSGTDVNLIEVGGAGISLGENTMANSLPVVIASDQDPIPITGSISATNPSVGATGADVPTDATYIGVSNAAGDLTGLASVAVDLNSTTPPVVPVHGFYQALPGAGGPVVGGTTTNPIRVAGTGTAGTANAGVATIQGIASMTPVQVSQATASNLNATVVQATAANLNVTATLAAGSAVVGHVITDTGSTTAVTGNVTVVQPTGTNLHVVTDSGTITTVSTVTAVTAITNALPAGNNNIGDVDVASVVPGTGASNLGKAESSAHTSADVGVLALGIANTTQTSLVSAGQYAGFATDLKGNLSVVGPVNSGSTYTGQAPVMAGALAVPPAQVPGIVSDDQVSNVTTDLEQILLVTPAHPRSQTKHLDGSTAYTDQALIATPGANYRIIITNIIASTGAATALNFFLEEGSTKIFGPIYLEAVNGRGFASGPIYLPCTANTAITLTSSASIPQSFQVDFFEQRI